MRSLITPFLVSISLLAVSGTSVAVEVVQPEIALADYSSPELEPQWTQSNH